MLVVTLENAGSCTWRGDIGPIIASSPWERGRIAETRGEIIFSSRKQVVDSRGDIGRSVWWHMMTLLLSSDFDCLGSFFGETDLFASFRGDLDLFLSSQEDVDRFVSICGEHDVW